VDDRQVTRRIRADDGCLVGRAVGELDRDRARALDDVVVRDDVALQVVDEPCPLGGRARATAAGVLLRCLGASSRLGSTRNETRRRQNPRGARPALGTAARFDHSRRISGSARSHQRFRQAGNRRRTPRAGESAHRTRLCESRLASPFRARAGCHSR
jgi:hypothetical protein